MTGGARAGKMSVFKGKGSVKKAQLTAPETLEIRFGF
jgi:hypothetical protein